MTELDSLPGLAGAKRAVEEFAQSGSGIHAVLFYGIRGAGKRRLSEVLAKAWLSNGEGESAAARSFENGRNADFLLVEPMGPSRIIREPQFISPKDGQKSDFNGVPVLEFLRTPPLSSAKKVVLVLDADRINIAAANVLLKSLEEPHDYAKFILTTTRVGSLPPTILSRCSAVACELPNEARDDALWLMAEGAPGRYEELLRKESVYRAIWQFGETLPDRGRGEALLAAEILKGLCDALQKATEQNARTSQAETLELLAIAVRHLHPEWHAARKEIVEAHRRIVGNGNSALVLDALMAQIL
jgi:DNA polymerase III delta prime subunit